MFWVGVSAVSVWAHPSALVQRLNVDESIIVTITVNAETVSPMSKIDIYFPDNFEFASLRTNSDWAPTATTTGASLTLAGSPVERGGLLAFGLAGRFNARAQSWFLVRTYAQDGESREFFKKDPRDVNSAVVVYAGVEPPEPEASSSNGILYGSLLVGAGVIVGAVTLWRTRRARR